MKYLKRALFVIFSTGWIIPLLWSGHCLFFWLQNYVSPFVNGKKPEILHSFPHLYSAEETFGIAMIWFLLVAITWSYLIYTKFLEKK